MTNQKANGHPLAHGLHPANAKASDFQNARTPDRRPSPGLSAASLRRRPIVTILGVPVSQVTLAAAVRTIVLWTRRRQAEYVCIRDVHGLILATKDPELMRIHRSAGMVTPDGMPLVWLSRLRAAHKTSRVCGSDLMDALCQAGQRLGLRHYFYGGKPGVAESMIENLKTKYPQMCVAGYFCPPFHALTEADDQEVVDRINQARAQIVWVGLSTPKQDFWMRDHAGRIEGATLIGVGAAFDFQSGAIARAPQWMQKSGLEWFYRLASEPRRLWRRYFVAVPLFLTGVAREQIELYLARKFSPRNVSVPRSPMGPNKAGGAHLRNP